MPRIWRGANSTAQRRGKASMRPRRKCLGYVVPFAINYPDHFGFNEAEA